MHQQFAAVSQLAGLCIAGGCSSFRLLLRLAQIKAAGVCFMAICDLLGALRVASCALRVRFGCCSSNNQTTKQPNNNNERIGSIFQVAQIYNRRMKQSRLK